MIAKVLTFQVDEFTNVGLYGDKYVMFDGDMFECMPDVKEILDIYIEKKKTMPELRIPDAFGAVKNALVERLAELQSL